jgi:hypothetical protein
MIGRIVLASLALGVAATAAAPDSYLPWEGGSAYYRKWTHGPPPDPGFFPVAVWLQDPALAADYRKIGVNLFIGLWRGPREDQLAALAKAGIPAIAALRDTVLNSPHAGGIVGWMHMDEPDNAQARKGVGWGPCILPPAIIEGYGKMAATDPSRPVYLNLGQGVINEKWVGRGEVCGHHDEHYAEYIRGADIVSYDVYPVNSKLPLWYPGAGVARLREWANYSKPVWTWIETTSIQGDVPKPTPAEIRAEVWLAIIHGAMGVGYFCHQFKPSEDAARPLHDSETRQALAAINGQIASLARVLNEKSVANGVKVESSNAGSPIDWLLKRQGGATYLFAAGARPGGETTATFRLRDMGSATAEVLGESRTVRVRGGVFRDRFANHEVHIYRIPDLPRR